MQAPETATPRPAWVYWTALALCLALSLEKALSPGAWSFNGQNILSFFLFFYGMQGLGQHHDAKESTHEQA